MCDCDYEPASAQREEWRKARKPHWCCECGATIKVGDRYHYFSGVWDNRGDSYKTCLECAQVRDWYVAENRMQHCWPAFGLLYDDWPRATLPLHVKAVIAERQAKKAA